jgi:hypothetical protein
MLRLKNATNVSKLVISREIVPTRRLRDVTETDLVLEVTTSVVALLALSAGKRATKPENVPMRIHAIIKETIDPAMEAIDVIITDQTMETITVAALHVSSVVKKVTWQETVPMRTQGKVNGVETIDPVMEAIDVITTDQTMETTKAVALIAISVDKKAIWLETVPMKTQDLRRDVVTIELIMELVSTVGRQGICPLSVPSLLARQSKDRRVVVVAALST